MSERISSPDNTDTAPESVEAAAARRRAERRERQADRAFTQERRQLRRDSTGEAVDAAEDKLILAKEALFKNFTKDVPGKVTSDADKIIDGFLTKQAAITARLEELQAMRNRGGRPSAVFTAYERNIVEESTELNRQLDELHQGWLEIGGADVDAAQSELIAAEQKFKDIVDNGGFDAVAENETPSQVAVVDGVDTPDNKEIDTPQNTENPEQEVNQEATANSSVEQPSSAGKDESQEGDQEVQADETGKTQSSAEKSVAEAEEEPDTAYEVLGKRTVGGREVTRLRVQRKTPDGRTVKAVMELNDEQLEKYFANQGIKLPGLESGDEPEETSEPAEPEQGQGEPEEEKAEEAPVAQTAPVVVPPVFTTFTGYAETPYTPTSAATPQTPASPTSGPEVTGPVLTGAAAAGPESQGEPSSDELRRQFIDEQVTRYRQADARLRRGYYEQAGQWASYREGTPERNRGEELLRLYREINDNEQYARVWPVVSGEQAGGQKTGLSALWQELGAAWKTDRAEGIMDVVNDKMGPEWSAAPAERRETRKPGRIRRGLGRAGRWLGIIRDDGRSERTDAEAADDQAQSDETNVVTTNR